MAAAVIALEEDTALAAFAADALAATGAKNARVVAGPLTAGWADEAPYDVIVLNGSTEIVPQALLGQLADGGRLVGVVGRAPMGKATLYRRSGAHVSAHPEFDAVAPLMPGFAKPPEFVF
jgi:protein-L-isoaspartate(D-aspartate) O-methyltransferase